MRIDRYPTPNYEPGRDGATPRGIVLHTSDGSFESAITWFSEAESRVSAHYLVGTDGEVGQFVDEVDTARHAGDARPVAGPFADVDVNRHTIGIELADDGDPYGPRTDQQHDAAVAIVAEAAARWDISLDREHVVGHRELGARKGCPGSVDVDHVVRLARERPASPLLAVLLPARNAADDVPDYLESVGRFADAVVALDDGSTDATRDLLEASPLVKMLLAGPHRDGYAGWDDLANRTALLRAAEAIEPRWVMYLDADERLDPEDGRALREFLTGTDPLPGCAYGFQHFRMWDGDRYDPDYTWIWRLFAFQPDLSLPARRLHFNPVPTSIPREAWVRTTIRVRHLGAADEARDLERIAKYDQADPEGAFPRGLGGMDRPPEDPLPRWSARPEDLPALLDLEEE